MKKSQEPLTKSTRKPARQKRGTSSSQASSASRPTKTWTPTPQSKSNSGSKLTNDASRRVFESGAQRSTDSDDLRLDLICHNATEALAKAYTEGVKYGEYNWTKGMPLHVVFNHLQNHLLKWQMGYTDEDHLGHAMWGIAALIHFTSGCKCHHARRVNDNILQEYLTENPN